MKQISFFTFFTIISLSHYFSQVKIDGRKLNENNGKYYSNNNLFNGNAYFLNPNEQLKEIVEFKNGEKKGVITTYYQDENYISSSYLDSVIARNLEIKNREQKTLVDKLISDTLNTCLKWRNYFTEKIGGTEKWLKLKDKYDNNKLKGKKYELVQEYINLGSYHSASVRYYLKEKKILDQFEKELKNEKSKPIYSNKIFEVFKINNNLKDGYYTSFYQNGNKKTEGLINKGLKEEIWFEYFENGSTESEINYANDVKNGQYKYFHLNGLINETGFYKNDNNDGLVEIFDENSNKIEEYNYKNGIRHGEWKSFYENGILKEIGYFKDNLQDSVFKNFNPNGILVYECYFDRDEKNGPCKEFDFENGKLLQETYCFLNQKDGICKIYDENEKLIEETLFKSNKKNGISKLYFSNGKLKEEGFFVDDKKNGSFKSYDENGLVIKELIFNRSGILIEESNYLSNIKDGISTDFYENGKKRLIKRFQLGKLNGEFISFDSFGDTILNSTYKNNVLNGSYQEYSNKVTIVSGSYVDGLMTGLWIYKNKTGIKIGEGNFDKGNSTNKDLKGIPRNGRTGKWKFYFDSGVIQQESSFVNGKMEGEFKEWYPNGKLSAKGKYSNGFQNELWIYYFDNGNMKGKGNYNMGNGTNLGSTGIPKHGRNGNWEIFDSNGKISHEQNWLAGQENGIHKWYYENGNLKLKGIYKNGKEEGLFVSYYENGSKNAETNYSSGKKDGLEKVFYSNGILKTENNYENGTEISSIRKNNEDGTAYVPVNKNEPNNDTPVYVEQAKEREKCYECSGTGKCQICNGKPFEVCYCIKEDFQCREEIRPGLKMCNVCRGAGAVYEYSVSDQGCIFKKECNQFNCMNGWLECYELYCVNGICKECKGDGFKD